MRMLRCVWVRVEWPQTSSSASKLNSNSAAKRNQQQHVSDKNHFDPFSFLHSEKIFLQFSYWKKISCLSEWKSGESNAKWNNIYTHTYNRCNNERRSIPWHNDRGSVQRIADFKYSQNLNLNIPHIAMEAFWAHRSQFSSFNKSYRYRTKQLFQLKCSWTKKTLSQMFGH